MAAGGTGGGCHRLFRPANLGQPGRRRPAGGAARRLAGARSASAGGRARHPGLAGGGAARHAPVQLPGRLRRHAGGAAPARGRHRAGLVARWRWAHAMGGRDTAGGRGLLPAGRARQTAAAARSLPGHRPAARHGPGRDAGAPAAACAWRRPAPLSPARAGRAAAVPAAAGIAGRGHRRRRQHRPAGAARGAPEHVRHPRQHGLGRRARHERLLCL
ncbi:hypothetical protein D3C81_897950 [compost metagenome]